jgi:hypothetical protein
MKHRVILSIALALISQFVLAGSITDTYTAGDTLTAAKMDNIKSAVNGNATDINTHQTQIQNLSTGCPVGSSIRTVAVNGTITCEPDSIKTSGVLGINSTVTTTISTTTNTLLATLTITDSGTFNVALNAHFTVEISGTTSSRLKAEIRNTSCTGTILGEAMWRPGGSVSDSSFNATTLSLTGFQSGSGPGTFVLCARKFDTTFPDASIFLRGFNLTYSN